MKILLPQQAAILTMSLILMGCGVDDSNYTSPTNPPEEEKPSEEKPEEEKPEEEKPEEEKPEEEKPEEEKPEEEKPEEEKPEEEKPTEPDPTPPAQSAPCNVNYDQWKTLDGGDSVKKVNSKLACNGFLYTSSYDVTGKQDTYIWGENLLEPTVQVTFVGSVLNSAIYFPQKEISKKLSSCYPKKEVIEKITGRLTQSQVESLIGCKGTYQGSTSLGSDDINHMYLWTKSDKSETLTIVFDQDNVLNNKENIIIPKVEYSTCTPNQAQWENVWINDSYEIVRTKLGNCEGINTDPKDTTNQNTTRIWGKDDGSTDSVYVNFWQGYVSSKQFVAKEKITTCPIATYSQWQAAKIDSSYAKVKDIMKCEGNLYGIYSASNIEKYLAKTYVWQNIIPPNMNFSVGLISHKLAFDKDQLVEKVYVDYTQPFSVCTPTIAKFDKIELKANWSKVKDSFGAACPAKLTDATEDLRTTQKRTVRYSWGSLKDGEATTFAYVSLDKDNNVVKKFIQFKPK